MNTSSGANINKNNFNIIKYIKKDLLAWLMLLPSLILFIIFAWQPLISGLVLSLFETKGFEAVKYIGLQNFADVMSDPTFIQTLVNTFVYVLWSLIIGFLLPIVVAIVINETVHFNSFFRFSVYFPTMIPAIATAIMWYFIFYPSESGLLNMFLINLGVQPSQWIQDERLTIMLIIVTATWRAFGGTTIIYLASLQGINPELYEAATLDGAGIWAKIRSIIIPGISNIIGLMFIMQIIGVFQIFQEPLAMTGGGPNNASMSLILKAYNYGFSDLQAGRSMATGTITFLILMVFTIIYFRLSKNKDSE